jgi:hypothetical protein
MTSPTLGTIRIVRVHLGEDLRATHALRARVRCRAGEAELFINTAETIARIGFSNGTLLGYWHEDYYPGQAIDTDSLIEELQTLRLRLVVSDSDRGRIDGIEIERKKAA